MPEWLHETWFSSLAVLTEVETVISLALAFLGFGCLIASFILGPCAESRSVRKWKKTARRTNGNRMDPDEI